VLAIGFAAVVFWFSVPEPGAPLSMASVAESWQLPGLPAKDPKKAAEIIAARNLWGIVPPAPEASPSDPAWHFAGVARRGSDRYVLIKFEGKPVQTLKTGDVLPGGAKILEIGEDQLCILINGKRRALGIYRQ